MNLIEPYELLDLAADVESFMLDVCEIERGSDSDGPDNFGQLENDTWTVIYGSAIGPKSGRCAFYTPTATGGETVNTDRSIIKSSYHITLPFGADVTELDRVKSVKGPDGLAIEIGSPAYNIVKVLKFKLSVTILIEVIK